MGSHTSFSGCSTIRGAVCQEISRQSTADTTPQIELNTIGWSAKIEEIVCLASPPSSEKSLGNTVTFIKVNPQHAAVRNNKPRQVHLLRSVRVMSCCIWPPARWNLKSRRLENSLDVRNRTAIPYLRHLIRDTFHRIVSTSTQENCSGQ